MVMKQPREWTPTIRRGPKIPLTEDEKRLRAASQLVPEKAVEPPFKTRYTKDVFEHIETNGRYGPFNRTSQQYKLPPNQLYRNWHKTSTWYRSKTKRRQAPNPYTMYFAELRPGSNGPSDDAPNTWAYSAVVNGSSVDALASNQARSAFVGAVRDKNAASLAVTLAEWGQSQKMIVHRASQLLGALKAARRLDPKGIQKALGIQKMPKTNGEVFREKGKSGSNLWLEYSFGWKPMVQDIYEAVKVLSSNPPAQKVVGRGRYRDLVQIGNFGQYSWTTRASYDVNVLIAAEVFVSNPNLALANQLGIVNPATVAWELVPFSFLVDWFVPVSGLLNSWTDLLGYKIEYPFTTTKRVCTASQTYPMSSATNVVNSFGVGMIRTLGIPPFRMTVPPFEGFSVARGANAISLVIQQFLKMRPS